MTPQARGFPESPVVKLSPVPPRPRSSGFAVTTIARPTIPRGPPDKDISGSTKEKSAVPSSPTFMLPKSPTCRTWSVGPPCCS